MKIQRIAVIGAGAAGRGFAAECVRAGYEVVLEDVMPAKLRRAEAEVPGEAPGLLRLSLTVEEAVRDADLAVDFVPDELESKLEIFSMIDRMAPPRTILCTPSEALSITDLASCVYRPERCFAVRGGLGSAVVQLVHPRGAGTAHVETVVEFLSALGRQVDVVEDAEDPMLMKNVVSGAG